jgi:hypothetical protein
MWIKIGWLFSMARSGTSIASYGAAAPWGHPVCDEPFGPWDRTTPPFNHPRVQRRLMKAFEEAGHSLTAEIVPIATSLFNQMGERTGSLVCKIPHQNPTLDQLDEHFPGNRRVLLIRNPLHRLNSLFARGWTESAAEDYDLERYRAFAARWLAEPIENRLVYDQIREDPEGFFRKMYEAWGWLYERQDVRRAASYCASHYHHRSKRVDEGADPSRVVSESQPSLPAEAVEAYLADPLIVDLMGRLGWSTRPEDYLAEHAAGRRA